MKEEILSHLSPRHPWREQLQWFDTVDSTNTRCKEMALAGAPHGTVLIAGHQTAGRGRLGRSFQSPDGQGVYLSVLLRPDCAPTQLMHLTCAAAVAACDGVEQVCGLRPGIKWTNDLVVGKRKIAGILTELVHGPNGMGAIIGIGINCRQRPEDFPGELRNMAASLSTVTGRDVDPIALAAALVESLEQMSRRLLTDKDAIMARYRADCVTVGQDISLVRADTVRRGHAEGVDDSGALLVRFPDGHLEAVASGEVSIRGMYGYIL